MSRFLRVLSCVIALALGTIASAEEPRSSLSVPLVTLRKSTTLADALSDVSRQTGVRLTDALRKKGGEVELEFDKLHFWPALDRLAASAKAKVAQSPRDGAIVLHPVDPDFDRPSPLSYDGPFRFRATRVTAARDLDSLRGGLVVGLEVSWTPTLRPLFIDGQPHGLRFAGNDGKPITVPDEGGALVAIDGRYSFPLEVTLPAVPREQKQLRKLEGKLAIVVPTKMLSFSFDANLAALDAAKPGGEQRRLTLEGVTCGVGKIAFGSETWSVQMALDYPEGNHPLESFQAASLVANNELVLRSRDGKRRLTPANGVVDQVGSRRALVTYHFVERPGAARGKPSDWSLSYAAPARIVEVRTRFAFDSLPLP